jgi:hypothetical protein
VFSHRFCFSAPKKTGAKTPHSKKAKRLSHHFLSCFPPAARHHDHQTLASLYLNTRRGTMLHRLSALVLVLAVLAGQAPAADTNLTDSLKSEPVTLKSAGPLAFGPQGILFIGDPRAATIYAVDTNDRTAPKSTDRPKVEGINEKIASMLGTEANQIRIADLAVNPISGNAYLSVARGLKPDSPGVIIRLSRSGNLGEFPLKDVKSAKVTIPNAKEGRTRLEQITHLAYFKGRVIVAGLSNEDWNSTLRAIPFPFTEAERGTSVQIFHGAHGKFETNSPVRIFTTYKIGDEDNLLAAYQCTPLVKIPVSQLKPGEKIKGTTVAELGNGNRPLSMIVYQKGGKDYVLMANNSRGLMKIKLEGVDTITAITSPVKGGKTAGLTYETIEGKSGVRKLDAFDKDHAVVLLDNKGRWDLETMELP